ncbi:MAG: ABC transporter substrate-binding protein [Gaiellaceae bacterium]
MTDRPCDEQVSSAARLTRRRLIESAAAAGIVLGSAGSLGAARAASAAIAATPKRGGTLRIGMVGGGQSETLDPNLAVSTIDTCRMLTLYDLLVHATPDLSIEMRLATSFEPNKNASVWTIKLRKGVVWHDGRPFGADDVMYTLRRIAASKTNGALPAVQPFDLKRMRRVNAHELELPLHVPIADLAPTFVFYPLVIVQNGATNFRKPVGTGAFMANKFKPGQGSLFTRNPHYWMHGLPFVDAVEISSIPDAQARLDALLSGQVHAVEQLTFAQAKEHQGKSDIRVLVGNGPQIVPITMSADLKPFNDVRVRQAFRLMADRPALVRGAQFGFGQIGNDLAGKGLKWYAGSLPQRHQDIAKAKFLLKKAGADKLTVTLYSSTAIAGMLESATIFAQQARKAGVTVNVNNGPPDTYFASKYLKWAFGQTNWPAIPIPNWINESLTSKAFYNETHWKRPSFDRLVLKAQAEQKEARAKELWFEVQKVLYDQGGYLIWGFAPFLDGVSRKLNGVVPSGFFALGNFDFQHFWLA